MKNPPSRVELLSKLAEIVETSRVSVQGVESLWGDCRFIPADWES